MINVYIRDAGLRVMNVDTRLAPWIVLYLAFAILFLLHTNNDDSLSKEGRWIDRRYFGQVPIQKRMDIEQGNSTIMHGRSPLLVERRAEFAQGTSYPHPPR